MSDVKYGTQEHYDKRAEKIASTLEKIERQGAHIEAIRRNISTNQKLIAKWESLNKRFEDKVLNAPEEVTPSE